MTNCWDCDPAGQWHCAMHCAAPRGQRCGTKAAASRPWIALALLALLLPGCASYQPYDSNHPCLEASRWHADEEARWATVNWTRSDWHRDQRQRFSEAYLEGAGCSWWNKELPWEPARGAAGDPRRARFTRACRQGCATAPPEPPGGLRGWLQDLVAWCRFPPWSRIAITPRGRAAHARLHRGGDR